MPATEQAKQFALQYIENELPADNAYNIRLSLSHDDPELTQFDLYPEDNGKTIEMADVSKVITTLLRKGKVPVWIDISVSEIKENKTVLTLLCAGRYSDNINEMYYYQRGMGPFGVKSPNLPVDYKKGTKFKYLKRKLTLRDVSSSTNPAIFLRKQSLISGRRLVGRELQKHGHLRLCQVSKTFCKGIKRSYFIASVWLFYYFFSNG